jgi:hypothetical protein
MRDGRINVAIVVSEAAFTARTGRGQHAPIARPCGLRYTGAGGRHWPGPPGRPAGPGHWPAATVTGSLGGAMMAGAAASPRSLRCHGIGADFPDPGQIAGGNPESRDSDQTGIPNFPKFRPNRDSIPGKPQKCSGQNSDCTLQRQARLLRFLVGVPGWEKRLIVQ